MVAVPAADGVKLTRQVADAPVPEREQDPEKAPLPPVVSANVAEGVNAIPADVSATVTVQPDADPVLTGLLQLMLAFVARKLTVIMKVAELVLWVVSPP